MPRPRAHEEHGEEHEEKREEHGPHAVDRPVPDGRVVRLFELLFQAFHRGLEEQKRDERPEGFAGEAREGVDVLARVDER